MALVNYIEWQPKFVLNLDPIDQHHMNLVELINDFHTAVENELDEELLIKIFARLREYADYHFRVEEALMVHNDYPETDEHIANHRAFTSNIGRLESHFVKDERVSSQVLVYLKGWLEQHILVIDRQLADHVHAHKR